MSTTALTKVGTKNAEQVVLLDSSGTQVDSFGGGTQYSDGAAQATPTGTVALGHDGSNVRAVTTDSDGDLQVDVKTMPTTTVQATNLDIRDLTNTDVVTAELSATDNAVLDDIAANQTDASQKTQIVDGSGNVIAATSNALNVHIASGSSSGTQYTEDDAAAANPVGTVPILIRKDTPSATVTTDGDNIAQRGSDFGAAYVTLIDSTGAEVAAGGGTQYEEDTAHSSGDKLTMAGVVRADTAASLADTDGDRTALIVDASGRLHVNVGAMPTTTVQATNLDIRDLTNADVVTAELSATDNAVLDTIETNTDSLTVVGGGLEATALRVTLANDSTGVLSVDDNGSTLSIDDGGGVITVDGTVTANLAAGTNNIGDVDVLTLPGTGVEDAAETAGGTLLMAGTVRRDTAASSAGTTGDNATLNTDSLGRLWVSGAAVEDAAETAGGILLMAGSVRRDTAASSAGTTGDNATVNTDALGKLWVTGSYAEDAAHTTGDALNAVATRRIDTAATSAGTSGDYATLDASAEGALWVTNTPTTTSGCTIFRSIDLDESEEEVKATAGNVYGYYVFNAAASVAYLKFYNATAANVTVGTTTPVMTFPVPAGAAANVSFAYPISFSTAICVAVTTGLADADTGAPAANAFIANILYK